MHVSDAGAPTREAAERLKSASESTASTCFALRFLRHVSVFLSSGQLHRNMPPGPAYNWLCVASSVCNILSHAAHIRAAQLARAGQAVTQAELLSRRRKGDESYPYERSHVTEIRFAEGAELEATREPASKPPDVPQVPNEPLQAQQPVASVEYTAPVKATEVRKLVLFGPSVYFIDFY